VLEEKWPVLGRHERAAGWLRVWTDLGRAPRTIDAYARGLAEFLQVCEDQGIDPVTANRADVAVFVRELTGRPSRRGTNVVSIDSGCGLANATIQQRCRCGCSSISWLRRVFGSRILLDGADTRLTESGVASSAAWCRGW
jgi:hypothetical protein